MDNAAFVSDAIRNNRAMERNVVILAAGAIAQRFHRLNRARLARKATLSVAARDRKLLLKMSDRDLADIGLKRGMIEHIFHDA